MTLYDNTGSIAIPGEWDLNAVASGVGAAAQSNFYIRNNAGANMLMIEAVNGGGTVDRSIFYTDIIPDAANTRKVGTTSVPFSQVNARTATFQYLNVTTGAAAGLVLRDATGAGAATWGYSDEYDVRNFGAACDGTTDDTAAIEAAIAAGAANKHKAILPQGTCKVTTIDIANSYGGIRGQGRSNSILFSTTNAPIIRIDNAGPLYYLEFSDFQLKGSGAGTSQNGIESATAGFGVSTIHNLYFDGLWRGVKLGHTTDLGDNNILDCAFSMSVTNSVGIESLHTSSGSIWSRNFFGGTAEALGATSGNRAFYLHGYVGDTIMDGNHMEGGWIGFDISCDNGTFATGLCSYGENLVITSNKIDGYALDFRLYNLHNSTILGNRGRGVLDAQITGTSTSGMIYDVVGRTDTGSAIERAGWKLTTSTGDTAINAYDEGRIRLGTVTSNLSNTRNGISIQDQGASSAIALGQSTTRNMGMMWDYNATAGSAYGLLYTFSYSNPLLYGASSHQFVGANGPALGSGQNIAPVWVSAGSGFVGYGFYRTDDTNGGWLLGTSGVAVGDFAIYQNQGAGVPARRLSINPSGAVDVAGALSATALTINTGAATVGHVWTATSTGGAGSWQAIPTALPVVDTTGIAKGSSDATKIARLEVDGLTTGTTRVLTVQDGDYILAGLNINQTFVNPQTIAIASVQTQMTLAQTNSTATYDPACLVLASTDTVTSTIYGAARVCAGYESAAFTDEKFAIQTATGSGTYQDALTIKNQAVTILGSIAATGSATFSFVNGVLDGTMVPLFSGNGSIGSATYKYGDFFGVRGNFNAATIGAASATVRLGQNLDVNYSGDFAGMAINTWSATGGHGGVIDFNKSGSGTIGTQAAVVSGETLGFLVFRGSDGTAFQRAAQINGEVDGTVSSGVVPGRILLRTASTSGVMTERIRVDSAGLTTITGDLTVTGTCTGCGGSTLPVIDTTNIVKGSADATKLLRFEVDGITTGTTRTLTPQNNSYTLAGTDIAQTFSSTQTFSGTLAVSGTIGDDLTPSSDGTFTNGTTSFRWGSIATYNADFNGVLTLQSGTTITGSILPTTNNLYALGNTSYRWSNVATVNANISGTLTAPSGGTGVSATKTVRDSAGTGTCTLIFSGGILTGGTC